MGRRTRWSLSLRHGSEHGTAPEVMVSRNAANPWLHVLGDDGELAVYPDGPPSGEHIEFANRLAAGAQEYAASVEGWARCVWATDDDEEGRDR